MKKQFKAFKKDNKVWVQAINPFVDNSITKYPDNKSWFTEFKNANPPILSPSLTDGEVYNEEDLEFGYYIEGAANGFITKKMLWQQSL